MYFFMEEWFMLWQQFLKSIIPQQTNTPLTVYTANTKTQGACVGIWVHLTKQAPLCPPPPPCLFPRHTTLRFALISRYSLAAIVPLCCELIHVPLTMLSPHFNTLTVLQAKTVLGLLVDCLLKNPGPLTSCDVSVMAKLYRLLLLIKMATGDHTHWCFYRTVYIQTACRQQWTAWDESWCSDLMTVAMAPRWEKRRGVSIYTELGKAGK